MCVMVQLAQHSFRLLGLGDLRSSWQHCSPSVRKLNINNLETVLQHNMCKPNKCTEYTQTNTYTCVVGHYMLPGMTSYLASDVLMQSFRCIMGLEVMHSVGNFHFPQILNLIKISEHVTVHHSTSL